MGVEHALVCKKCKTWIDLHKCYQTQMLCDRHSPYHPHNKDQRIEPYWGGRALWYIWKHLDHGGELAWMFDTGDEYWEMQGYMTEEASHDKMWNEKSPEMSVSAEKKEWIDKMSGKEES